MDAPAQSLSPEMQEKIAILRFSTNRPQIVDELVAIVHHRTADNIVYSNEIVRLQQENMRLRDALANQTEESIQLIGRLHLATRPWYVKLLRIFFPLNRT